MNDNYGILVIFQLNDIFPCKGVIEVQCTTDDMGFEIDQLAYFEDKERKIAKEETAEADYQRDLR